MPSVSIYKNGLLVVSKEFSEAFYVSDSIVQEGVLYWKTFQEETWKTESEGSILDSLERSGVPRHIWLHRNPEGYSAHFRVKLVRPEWTLKIMGIECERGSYLGFDILWPQISLIYQDYAFEFSFSEEEIGVVGSENVRLPAPLVPYK